MCSVCRSSGRTTPHFEQAAAWAAERAAVHSPAASAAEAERNPAALAAEAGRNLDSLADNRPA